MFPQSRKSFREALCLYDRQMKNGSHGSAYRFRTIKIHRPLRTENSIRSGCIRRPQNCPCIAWILQILQYHQKRILLLDELAQVKLPHSDCRQHSLRMLRIGYRRKDFLRQNPNLCLRTSGNQRFLLRILFIELLTEYQELRLPWRAYFTAQARSFYQKQAIFISSLFAVQAF